MAHFGYWMRWCISRPLRQDGRAVRVYFTTQGKALQQPILQVWEDLEAQMLANLTTTEQTLLRRLLMQALANLTTLQDEA
jgi:DNA-binding MarR family transcriptional regulator